MAFIPVTDYTVKKHINRDLHGYCLIWTGEADMRYNQKILLKNGKEALLKNGDAAGAVDNSSWQKKETGNDQI